MRVKQVQIEREPAKEDNRRSFWDDKIPCWQMCHCPENIRNGCPALKYQHLPCWEIEGTYLKLSDDTKQGDDISICSICRVYERYGRHEPIKVKLRGRGLDSYCKSLQEMCARMSI